MMNVFEEAIRSKGIDPLLGGKILYINDSEKRSNFELGPPEGCTTEDFPSFCVTREKTWVKKK